MAASSRIRCWVIGFGHWGCGLPVPHHLTPITLREAMSVQRRARGGPAGRPSPAIHENPFDDVLEQVDRAAQVLGLADAEVELLKHPKRQVIVSLPVPMDDGTIQVFTG